MTEIVDHGHRERDRMLFRYETKERSGEHTKNGTNAIVAIQTLTQSVDVAVTSLSLPSYDFCHSNQRPIERDIEVELKRRMLGREQPLIMDARAIMPIKIHVDKCNTTPSR